MTSMPSRSAGIEELGRGRMMRRAVGVLPIAFSRRRRNSGKRVGRATPTPAWSWVVVRALDHDAPPVRRSRRSDRTGSCECQAHLDASTTAPSARIVVRACAGPGLDDHSRGRAIASASRRVSFAPAARRRASIHPGHLAPSGSRIACSTTTPAAGSRPRARASFRPSPARTRNHPPPRSSPRCRSARRGAGRLEQPDVAIDAGALVVPTFLHRGVDAHRDDVVAAVVDVVGDVVARGEVAARFLADEEAFTRCARRGRRRRTRSAASAQVGRGNEEVPPIPADAVSGKPGRPP